jgi:hypothetical protein
VPNGWVEGGRPGTPGEVRWQADAIELTCRMSTTVVTVYGVCALTFMMAMYALERRHRIFVLAFALGCLLSSAYGFLSKAWPFGVVEAIWSVIVVERFVKARRATG